MKAKKPSMEGYAKVAELMSAHSELAIFRQFKTLNLQLLLYQQAELTHLETELRALEESDIQSGCSLDHHQDWWTLAHDKKDSAKRQWELAQRIQQKLETYSTDPASPNNTSSSVMEKATDSLQDDNVRKLASLSKLESPLRRNLDIFRSWMERPAMGAFPIFGIDGDSWDAKHERDLVALKSQKTTDAFSKWLSSKFIPGFHRHLGRKFKQPVSPELGNDMFEYSDKAVRQAARFVSTLLASAIPLLSVAILYTVQSNTIRLGIITILSSLFSITLSLTTNARGIEVFAATSAFAAINGAYLSNSR